MKTTNTPVIELRGIKHSAFASQETFCYEAKLYVDGKLLAIVSNDGHGGCDNCRPVKGRTYDEIRRIEEQIKDLPKRRFPAEWGGGEYSPSLETICADLVTEWLHEKDFKRAMQRVSYVKADGSQKGVFQLPAKYKPTAETMAAIKAKCAWAVGCTFLHDLPLDEARKTYFANMA